MRSFVAVEVPAAARAEVAGLLAQVRQATALRVKWVKPAQMHLTLAFFGEVTPEFVEKVKGQLAGVAPQFKPIACRLSGCGAFPSPGRARVLWAGMSEGRDRLVLLHRAVNDALRPVGFEPESRPFSPHLTLGRLREPGDARFIGGFPFESREFSIDRLILFRSVLRPEGPEYSRLAEFALGS